MIPVTFDASCYRIAGRSIHLHSGEFHYFRVPKADWRRRMELFKEAGGNCLATYIPWLIHEPQEGRFVFGREDGITDLEGFLRLAAEVGLYVIAKPGPHQYSELRYGGLASWLIPNHPGLRAKTLDGKDLGRSSVSYVHPLFLEKARNWFAKVCPLIARHQVEGGGAVAFLQLDNELTGIHFWNGGPDYNAEAMGFGREDGRFARFLERRHGDVRQLNESWGTDFERLADARPVAIEPTRNPLRLRAMKDYIEFYLDTISEYVSTLASWALLSRDGAAVLIPFVNKGATAKDVRIVMLDASPSDQAAEVQCVSGDLTDKNTAEHPHRVAPSSFQAPAGGLITLPGYSTGVIRVALLR